MKIQIKDKYQNTVIAFGGKGNTPLKDYTDKDLVNLAILAQSSGSLTLLDYFEGALPGLQALQAFRVKIALTTPDIL